MPGWWITTALGILAGIAIQLTQNCVFGPEICTILAAFAAVTAPILGISHSGNFKTPENIATIPGTVTTMTSPTTTVKAAPVVVTQNPIPQVSTTRIS